MDKEYSTKSKTGKMEDRIYEDFGKFIIYSYMDENTGKKTKRKLILLGKNKQCAYFLIPVSGKELAITTGYDLDAKVEKDGESIKLRDIIE